MFLVVHDFALKAERDDVEHGQERKLEKLIAIVLEDVKEVDEELNEAEKEYGPAPDAKEEHVEHESNRELEKVGDELVEFDAKREGVKIVDGRVHADRESARRNANQLHDLQLRLRVEFRVFFVVVVVGMAAAE